MKPALSIGLLTAATLALLAAIRLAFGPGAAQLAVALLFFAGFYSITVWQASSVMRRTGKSRRDITFWDYQSTELARGFIAGVALLAVSLVALITVGA